MQLTGARYVPYQGRPCPEYLAPQLPKAAVRTRYMVSVVMMLLQQPHAQNKDFRNDFQPA
jgi:hypothetical protein